MLNAPEQRRGGFEAKANLGSAALLLAKVDDSAILLLASGDISQHEPFAQSDGYGQSNKTTVSAKHDSTRGIYEWSFVGQLAFHDHGQLRTHSLGAPEVNPDPIAFGWPLYHILLAYASPLVRPTEACSVWGVSGRCGFGVPCCRIRMSEISFLSRCIQNGLTRSLLQPCCSANLNLFLC